MHSALIIFIITYIIIAMQNIPNIHISRPAGALLGAVAMVFFGVISIKDAYTAIDWNTILFLLGMMIIVAYVELSGFFELAEHFILTKAKSPQGLLLLVIFSSGIFSSLFMNDTICLLFTPIIIKITKRAQVNPIPYLIGLATSSNIGSVMTIMGNPQNMLIGIYSEIPFLEFFKILAPVSFIGLLINFLLLCVIYKKEIAHQKLTIEKNTTPLKVNPYLLTISGCAICSLLILLCLGCPPPQAAITIACVMIIAGATKPRKALEQIDWPLLLFFAGLFVVMKGVEKSALTELIFTHIRQYLTHGAWNQMLHISLGAITLSNIISNVPAVLLFSQFILQITHAKLIWLTLAMASTLAGNLTVIGSVANIIVFESARDEVKISFWQYIKVGVPLSLITIGTGLLILSLQLLF